MDLHRRRRFIGVLVASGGITTTGTLASLPANLCSLVGLPVGITEVHASPRDSVHLALRRGITRDAAFVREYLRSVISAPSHYSKLDLNGRFSVAAEVGGTGGRLRVAIKWVSKVQSSTGEDELWLRTAHPLGKDTWQRYCRTGKLLPTTQQS